MDRITQLRIRNVRAIESMTLDFGESPTVLIGENGSGKSTIIECLELLRKAAEPGFVDLLYSIHRGLPALLRRGAPDLTLGVRIRDTESGEELDYEFTLRPTPNGGVQVAGEFLSNVADGFKIIQDWGNGPNVYHEETNSAPSYRSGGGLTLSDFGTQPPDRRIGRVIRALSGIEVHLPFDTRATWAARTYQRPQTLRAASTLFPARRLALLGSNLANAWAELRNRDATSWDRLIGLVRLGLGDRVDNIMISPDPGGGNVYLAVRFRDLPDEPILAADLSDGQLSWLAYVAMANLNPGRSLLAIDEPELHLHPNLLAGVIALLDLVDAPVLLSTHSDRVLEQLNDPAESVRVCSLDERGLASAQRLDEQELRKWLDEFGDFAQIRAAGYLSRVLEPTPKSPAAS
jgi:predicted ATPase